MEIKRFFKLELSGWKPIEVLGLFSILCFILINAYIKHDNPIAVISAVCGILYTIIAGKGKISCYFFGLCGSGFYSYLALRNALYGNLFLYLCYYIPMQILGIFKWKNNLNKKTNEIVKTRLSTKERIKLVIISAILCDILSMILYFINDSNPALDGTTTMLSLVGMYLTVKRCIEQWVIWAIVNAISILMWIKILMHGEKVYATVIMWSVYFILAIYFYFKWRKELYNK